MIVLFFFNDTATTEIYTLSLHDALPISASPARASSTPKGKSSGSSPTASTSATPGSKRASSGSSRSEEHTSELQSRQYLVCRLLLEKKNPRFHGHLSPTSACWINAVEAL